MKTTAGKNYQPRKNSQRAYPIYRTPDWFKGIKGPKKQQKAKFKDQSEIPSLHDKYGNKGTRKPKK
jgi:hypothetical protein